MKMTSSEHVQNRDLAAPIYVVDDNKDMCLSLDALLSASGYKVVTFSSPLAFLAECDRLPPGVLLVDLRMEEIDGLEVVRRMGDSLNKFPAIMITAHGDVETAVRAIKAGARDFVQKPFRDDALTKMIDRVAEELRPKVEHISPKELLTDREREVAERLAKGLSNKQIAYDIGISVRTVEMHRARAMQRLGCKSFADLLRVLIAK